MSVDANNVRIDQLTLTSNSEGIQPNSDHSENVEVENSSGQLNGAFDDVVTTASKTPKSSRFNGVSYIRNQGTYQAQIGLSGKVYMVGNYERETDAAFAYDKAVQRLDLEKTRTFNFETFHAFKEAREQELAKNGNENELIRTDDELANLTVKIQKYIDIISAKIEAVNTSSKGAPNEGMCRLFSTALVTPSLIFQQLLYFHCLNRSRPRQIKCGYTVA
jgi:hypothetical protein